MNGKRNHFVWLLLLAFNLFGQPVQAQGFSYIYIQGDKKTPIYTRVEGVMMPRYGKNYALLSRLAPGPLAVEVLFQQNEFPPLTFNIMVPESGKRAFVLNRKDGAFSLYDVEQNFYLKAGNDISDDHLPTVLNNTKISDNKPVAVMPDTETPQTPEPVVTTPRKDVVAPEDIPETPIVTQPIQAATDIPVVKDTPVPAEPGKPKFIEDITFNNDPGTAITATGNGSSTSETTAVINSDCKGSMPVPAFLKLKNSISSKKGEDERLGILKTAIRQNCFSTEQAELLVGNLETDLARLSALKDLYPKITNQSDFVKLESLLSEEDSKSYFRSFTGNP
ncbi:MAG TPA: DUF4476 domain-containing protein [Chitinophagaceae bacterium]|nr:DUF4476 domain-containing protein [Chitinophagaceae bacterium]